MRTLDRLLFSLTAKKQKQETSSWRQYKKAILLPLARDEEVDAEQCELLLQDLGKTEDDLRKDVEELRARLTIQDRSEQYTKAVERDSQLEQQIEQLNEEFRKMREAILAKQNPLFAERESLRYVIQSPVRMSDLVHTVQDPEIRQQLAESRQRLSALRKKTEPLRRQLEQTVDEHRSATVKWHIDAITAKIEKLGGPGGLLENVADALLDHMVSRFQTPQSVRVKQELRDAKKELADWIAKRDKIASDIAAIDADIQREQALLTELENEAMIP